MVETETESPITLARFAIDAGDGDLRGGRAGRRGDRIALAADRVRGAVARRAVLGQLAAAAAEGLVHADPGSLRCFESEQVQIDGVGDD